MYIYIYIEILSVHLYASLLRMWCHLIISKDCVITTYYCTTEEGPMTDECVASMNWAAYLLRCPSERCDFVLLATSTHTWTTTHWDQPCLCLAGYLWLYTDNYSRNGVEILMLMWLNHTWWTSSDKECGQSQTAAITDLQAWVQEGAARARHTPSVSVNLRPEVQNCLLVVQGKLLRWYTFMCAHKCVWICVLEVTTPPLIRKPLLWYIGSVLWNA